ncbi:NAD(P)-binding domain-containing protein [Streptomyces sp. DSM 44917]|uniref:NAD(P)-binding domain-containing protein n=1 Tax=Streptomyces boetiae TaxID=3075541 RepID=A0ABU2L5D9_9ACTN|nr:NAD(P)-binding domain-containing protein [Streptomyces sp. DSM 44917]MDT0306641.1 NAD(P)-binding domain-containing protein [Streptomyces sp. DSM 44917]
MHRPHAGARDTRDAPHRNERTRPVSTPNAAPSSPARPPVTVIGLGAMGTAMAEALLAAGHPVTVWNRTASRAEPLVARGATLAASPAEAVAASPLTVLSLLDYGAMHDILGPVDRSHLQGRVLANLSSDTPERLREAARWASGRGAELITGGIMVPPPAVGKPGAYTFYSGPRAALEEHRETLAVLSALDHRGEDPGLAMVWYQAMLLVFTSLLTGYAHVAALLGTAGVKAGEARPYVADLLNAVAADGPLGILRELTREFDENAYSDALSGLGMMAAGTEHVRDAYREAGLDDGLPAANARLYAAALAAGPAGDGRHPVLEAIRNPAP